MGKSLHITTTHDINKELTLAVEKCSDYERGETTNNGQDTSISPVAMNHSCFHHYDQQQHNGGLHKKIKNSKIAKHTSEYLQHKLPNMTMKQVKNSSTMDDLPPVIVHFNHSSMHTRPSRDSDSILSNSSVATTSTWRATLGPENNKLISSLSAKQIKYQELLYELIMTEDAYLTDLQLVQQVFIADLELSWHILPEPIKQTFESINTIVEFHIAVLDDLRDCQSAQPPLIVGDVVERFRNYIPHIFNVYKDYFAHFEPANDMITKSLSDPQTTSLKIFGRYVQSQIECFEENDEAIHQHIQCMREMDAVIRSIEEYKIQTERSFRLIDLNERIRSLQEMGIRLNQPHRRLVHEGPLMLVPVPTSEQSSTTVTSTKKKSFVPPQRSFSESSKQFFAKQKKQLLYAFLFNDLVLFTKIRTKRISQAESELRANSAGGRNFYGPCPDVLFKLATVPGQITHLERIVQLQRGPPITQFMYHSNSTMTSSNRSSSWFGSFCRSGNNNNSKSKHSGNTNSFLSFCPYHRRQQHSPSDKMHVNPFQFICSIASKNIVNMLLEAKTEEEKQIWCERIESIGDEHCRRRGKNIGENSKQKNQQQQQPLATTTMTATPSSSSDNSNYANTEQESSPPTPLNASWLSENSLRSLISSEKSEDDDDNDSSNELLSKYSGTWDEAVTKSSIFSTESFNSMDNQKS
ncbi:hypothetical protein BDA99DRAFT_604204 [Phascolomyces articulosus]|uniref:DH domain-containing protein n=1 Tax=Phascolomyces articulosus TaxID=60185 RepID=A0AAD5K1J2_9FUNG|nr:hypothetical protein BDA99DRAFT_604204 [Phascolomyces articulosus]